MPDFCVGRAEPCGSAVQGRPAADEEQAPTNHSSCQNQFISMIPFGKVTEVKPIRTDLLILISAKGREAIFASVVVKTYITLTAEPCRL